MATLTVQGTVYKSGVSEYGPWAVVRETVQKRDGGTFETGYMCNGSKGSAQPTVGAEVVVTGYLRAGVRENDGKHYADIKIQSASFKPVGEQPAAQSAADDDEVPF